MALSDGASSISVTVRVRPFTIKEAAQLTRCDDSTIFLGDGSLAAAPTPKLSQKGLRSVIKVVDDRCLIFDPPEDNPIQKFSRSIIPGGRRVKDQKFGFDRIFDENITQGEVYEASTRPLLDSVLDGYNATVFAYGATGCGKTHTITGTVMQPGIIFMTMQELFERVAECSEEKVTEISLSYLEIYNETIRDLLSPGTQPKGLMLREDSNQAVSVAGLSSHRPQNVEEVMEMIMRGNELRTMSPTEANATSSRSHAVLQINVAQRDKSASVDEPHTMATLSIIDLAGSERASATKNRGERLLEGANINRSLLALGSCINALCDPRKRNHVPYRDSKLTRLLKFSLGGNCKTVMIVCVSPSSQHFDETQNTLRYANRAKNIRTKVTRNVYNVNRHVKDYLVKIEEQMKLISELKAQQKDSETIAFAKFKKQCEKKESIAREGVSRIRNAFETSAVERQERINNMIKLRQIGRRIAMLSSWITALEHVSDSLEDEDQPLSSMQAVRKTAQGLLVELENSRHHCQQKVATSAWDRSMISAFDHSVKQLDEIETGSHVDRENLSWEVELLKANAEREALTVLADQERNGDIPTIQLLLQAQFEIIATVEKAKKMDVDEAIEAASEILNKLMTSATASASHIVKPDGSLTVPVEAFAPSKTGTPKRRKQHHDTSFFSERGGGDEGSIAKKFLPGPVVAAPHMVSSPIIRASPRRRIGLLGSARKNVQFTPTNKKKQRSPLKQTAAQHKRAVRWRDDEDQGSLAEFEKTPKQQFDSSPPVIPEEDHSTELRPPVMSGLSNAFAAIDDDSPQGSSPLPTPPEVASMATATTAAGAGGLSKNGRFKTGFLAKKVDTGGSPNTSMMPPPPRLTQLSSSDVDSEYSSPLRELNVSHTQNRGSPAQPPAAPVSVPTDTESGSINNNSTDESNTPSSSNPPSDTENFMVPNHHKKNNHQSLEPSQLDREDTLRIRSAVRRASTAAAGRSFSGSHAHHTGMSRAPSHRRRSPSASTGSPPSGMAGSASASGAGAGLGDMFAAGHVRRMVMGGRDSKENHNGGGNGNGADWHRIGVLSPRVTGVVTAGKLGGGVGGIGASGGRRTTMATGTISNAAAIGLGPIATSASDGERSISGERGGGFMPGMGSAGHRVSSVHPGAFGPGHGHGHTSSIGGSGGGGARSSLMPGGKTVWR